MKQVMLARKWQPCNMGSMGNAMYMIIRQYQFPYDYDDNEHTETMDSDRVYQSDYDFAVACVKKHTGRGELSLGDWLEKSSDSEVFSFIKEFIKVDNTINWTGYRILGSVHRGNGGAIYSLQLFAKSPKSKTKVYSGKEAPNVEKYVR